MSAPLSFVLERDEDGGLLIGPVDRTTSAWMSAMVFGEACALHIDDGATT